jgi:hypothetical protein
MSIEATISVNIDHCAGSEIADPKHVVAWLCADGLQIHGTTNGFRFVVCTGHADPEDCAEDCDADAAEYKASIFAADFEDEQS